MPIVTRITEKRAKQAIARELAAKKLSINTLVSSIEAEIKKIMSQNNITSTKELIRNREALARIGRLIKKRGIGASIDDAVLGKIAVKHYASLEKTRLHILNKLGIRGLSEEVTLRSLLKVNTAVEAAINRLGYDTHSFMYKYLSDRRFRKVSNIVIAREMRKAGVDLGIRDDQVLGEIGVSIKQAFMSKWDKLKMVVKQTPEAHLKATAIIGASATSSALNTMLAGTALVALGNLPIFKEILYPLMYMGVGKMPTQVLQSLINYKKQQLDDNEQGALAYYFATHSH